MMKKRWIEGGILVSGMVAVLAAATPTFASSTPEGPGQGQEAESNLSLSVTIKNGDYVFQVSGIKNLRANTELYFRALTSSQTASFDGTYSKPNTSDDDQGTILPATDFTGVGGALLSGHHLPNTETFTMPIGSMPSGTASVTVAQYSIDRTAEHAGEGIASLPTIPPGQMPEVPYAAALPLVGVGAGLYLWRGHRRHA